MAAVNEAFDVVIQGAFCSSSGAVVPEGDAKLFLGL